jgi:hypothetical protein
MSETSKRVLVAQGHRYSDAAALAREAEALESKLARVRELVTAARARGAATPHRCRCDQELVREITAVLAGTGDADG